MSQDDSAVLRKIAANPKFQQLVKDKNSFVVGMVIFFIAFYFLLPILCGFMPAFMGTKVIGNITLAYLFAFVQFIMGWVVANIYVKRSAGFDQRIEEIKREAGL